MHNIWVFNIEEAAPNINANDEILTPYLCRYLWCVEPGDFFVAPGPLPEEFLKYICEIKNLPHPKEWLIYAPRTVYHLADAICQNPTTVSLLKSLAQSGQYQLEPYLETPKVVNLAEKTGLSCRTEPALVKEGLIEKLNSKSFFKALSNQLGIKPIPGFIASDIIELKNAISQTCQSEDDHAILKLVNSCGGYGNLAGTRVDLNSQLESWYKSGEVIVEPVLNFVETVGSLATITDDEVRFEGADSQHIENFGWKGCCYPRSESRFSEQIEQATLEYASRMQAMGARGWLNLDWGITKTANGECDLVAIESNFRHNGFKFILDVAGSIFEYKQNQTHIKHYHSYKLSDSITDFRSLLNAIQDIMVDGKPLLAKTAKADRGLLLMGLPQNNTVGMLIVGNSVDYIQKADALLKKKLYA